MSLTHAHDTAGTDTFGTGAPIDLASVDPTAAAVEFSALGKSPDEARVELFGSLTRLEPTTATGRMLEQTPEGIEGQSGRLPFVAVPSLDSLPFAPDEPWVPERRPRRRPALGAVAVGLVSAGFAATLFAGPGVGSGGPDRSFPSASRPATAEFGATVGPLGTDDGAPSWGATGSPGAAGSSRPFAGSGSPEAAAGSGPAAGRPDTAAGTGTPTAAPAMQPVRALFAGGRMIFTGSVASRADGDALVARASGLLGADAVVDQLVVDPAAPRVTALPVQVAERVRFAPGSSAIDGDFVALVSAWRDVLAAVPSVQMRVTGYTDDRGSASANDQLALARAQGLADWMVAQGIDGGRIVVAGGGASSPVASNDTPEGRAENRRIQVELDGLLTL